VLETRVVPGAKPLITPEMDDWLKGTVLSSDPTDYGYDTPLWTCEILAALLAREFGVRVIAATVNAHLKKLGLSELAGPTFRSPDLRESVLIPSMA
jgi:transposase